MSYVEWLIVIGINGAIIGFGIWKSRETTRTVDWFLAAKGLPWWIVGLSMFATAVDSGDYVAVAGSAYRNGLSYITPWWLGLAVGWLLVAYVVFLPLYRNGMFTNAEYLEARFDPTTRILSVFIQIQYRTNVLANVAYSLYLTFSLLTDWGPNTWWLVVGIAVGAALYTASGGLNSVALTDAAQSVVMLVAALILWFIIHDAVGGWTGLEEKLEAAKTDPDIIYAMQHVGGKPQQGVPPAIILFGWVVYLTAYCVVNHSQSMRMLAARSEWDLKMAACSAALITAGVMWFNVTLGILGRGLFPALASGDEVFPLMVRDYLLPTSNVLSGIVVAGLLAGGISTYDSIGSALAAVFTRDFYARFLVQYRDDKHYLWVSRIATVVVIAISFAYIPFLKGGMVALYVKLVGVTAVPLFVVYTMGILTRAHRASGLIGLCAGMVSGISRLVMEFYEIDQFFYWTNPWWGNIWTILITSGTMILVSVSAGWARDEEIGALMFSTAKDAENARQTTQAAQQQTWLERTRAEVPQMPARPEGLPTSGIGQILTQPLLWAGITLVVISYLNIFAFW